MRTESELNQLRELEKNNRRYFQIGLGSRTTVHQLHREQPDDSRIVVLEYQHPAYGIVVKSASYRRDRREWLIGDKDCTEFDQVKYPGAVWYESHLNTTSR